MMVSRRTVACSKIIIARRGKCFIHLTKFTKITRFWLVIELEIPSTRTFLVHTCPVTVLRDKYVCVGLCLEN